MFNLLTKDIRRHLTSILWPFADVRGAHCYDALIWIIYNLAGGLAPVWAGLIILKVFTRSPTWADFSQHGEFALYSAAMFAPAFYVINRDLKKLPGFAGRQLLALVTLLGMLTATCFFVAVTTAFMQPTPVLQINQTFLTQATIGLFSISVFISFIVTVIDIARQAPDVAQIVDNQRSKLGKQFDDLGRQQ